MDDAAWPGFYSVVAVAEDEGREEDVLGVLQAIAGYLEGAGIKIYELPVRQVGV